MWWGEQNFCRKPEVAYRTKILPRSQIHRPPPVKRSEVISQTLLPDWLAWARTVCQKRNEKIIIITIIIQNKTKEKQNKNFGYGVWWL